MEETSNWPRIDNKNSNTQEKLFTQFLLLVIIAFSFISSFNEHTSEILSFQTSTNPVISFYSLKYELL